MRESINFVESRWNYLSPFSAHEVEIDDVVYKTAEHEYQTLRMIESGRTRVKETTSPLAAWREAQVCKEENLVDSSQDKDELMEKIFRAKLTQHQDVKDV